MSDTPRTDTFLDEWNQSPEFGPTIELARTLERELTAAHAEIKRLRGEIEEAYSEGVDAFTDDISPGSWRSAWNHSRAKRVMEGKE